MIILTIVKENVTYRFTDVIKVGDHYIAHQVRDDDSIGKMEHRITQKEFDSGAFSEKDENRG